MVPLAESISNRYPELTMTTGAADTASRDRLMVVFWAASAGVESPVRIAAPVSGKHEVAAVEATPERNRLRENPLEGGTVCLFPVGTIFKFCSWTRHAVKCAVKTRPVNCWESIGYSGKLITGSRGKSSACLHSSRPSQPLRSDPDTDPLPLAPRQQPSDRLPIQLGNPERDRGAGLFRAVVYGGDVTLGAMLTPAPAVPDLSGGAQR